MQHCNFYLLLLKMNRDRKVSAVLNFLGRFIYIVFELASLYFFQCIVVCFEVKMSSSLQRYIAKVILLSIFIVCVFNKISANECKGVDTESKHLQLKQALLCNYDKYTRPGSNEKNATQITLWIKPQLLKSVKIF